MITVDTSHELFRAICEEYAILKLPDVENEAEVRLRLVDRILFECLGWPRSARVEVQIEEDRADYLLRDDDHRNWVIVEAKRTAYPLANADGAGKDGTRKFKLAGPAFSFGKQGAWPVFREQVVRYGAVHGTVLGVATNGIQWVAAAVPSRSGKALESEQAIVFASLEAVDTQYERFFNYLSCDGVRSRTLENHLLQERAWAVIHCSAPEHVISPDNVRPISRTPTESDDYYRELGRAIDIAFSPVEDDPHLIEHCFVESRESRDADDRLARLTELLTEYVAEGSAEYEETVQDESARLQADLAFAKPHHGTLAVLTGELSSGKTTFLRRFYEKTLPQSVRRHVRCAHVRFDKTPDLIDAKRILEAIAAALEEATFSASGSQKGQFLDIYHREWERHKLLFGDSETTKHAFVAQQLKRQHDRPMEYAVRLMELAVARHRKLPALVLDGFDHLAPDLQKAVLDAAVTLFQRTFSVVTVVMDDATAWRINRSGADRLISDYATLRVWLPRPKVGEVIYARFNYLKSIFEQQKRSGAPKASTTIGRGMRWTLDPERVAAFVRDALLFDDDVVKEWLAQLANYDLRAVLKLCRSLILSPAMKKEDVFVGFATGTFTPLTRPKILRALIKPQHQNFREHPQHPVHNIYSHNVREQHSPLSPFLLLALLEQRLAQDKLDKEEIRGFVSIGTLVKHLEDCYRIPALITHSAVERLWQSGLVQPYDPSLQVGAAAKIRIKITPRGLLHLRWAVEEWDYMREMGETTPICSHEPFEAMTKQSRAFHASSNEDAWKASSRAFAKTFICYLLSAVEPAEESLLTWTQKLRQKWIPAGCRAQSPLV
ncbi:MAG: hypothetical protein CSA65_00090 [Proteobacteria bacterium]|nr:MAG: hypothetical protein CSA65_00090 [Pseudomonadota bacterium]